jgi:hypothetical protein
MIAPKISDAFRPLSDAGGRHAGGGVAGAGGGVDGGGGGVGAVLVAEGSAFGGADVGSSLGGGVGVRVVSASVTTPSYAGDARSTAGARRPSEPLFGWFQPCEPSPNLPG